MATNGIRKLPRQLVTIERHILERQMMHPDASGDLTRVLQDIALAGKLIASHTTQAGLAEVLGTTNEINVQGEEVQKLDEISNDILFRLNDHTGRLAAMVSEEADDILHIPEKYPTGKYVLSFDPLDGSSNIDYNVSVGTIFAIHRRKSAEGRGTMEDCLQKGHWRVYPFAPRYSDSRQTEILQRKSWLSAQLESRREEIYRVGTG